MKLSNIEFKAMNNPVRRFIQKQIEFRNFKWLGLTDKNKNILEIGCGSGYGAVLLSSLEPKSYIGIDLMPEQIALTNRWHLSGYDFKVMDAADMQEIHAGTKDIIIIFCILHHIPEWHKTIKECCRVLTSGGKLFVEEPNSIKMFDKLFHWGHPVTDFNLSDLENELKNSGCTIIQKRKLFGFGTYHAQKV
jgi:Methylase involved in ubiquinone/menaquinone biosynthesis